MDFFIFGIIMKRIGFFLAALPVICLNAPIYEPPKRQATLSTAYAERMVNSNEGLADFPLTIIDAYGSLFDKATHSINGHLGARLATALVELPTLSYWLGFALFVPYHEFGHSRANNAFGNASKYGISFYGKRINGIPNYWVLSTIRLFTPPMFYPGYGGAFTNRIIKKPVHNTELNKYYGKGGESIVISASGLNNQSYLAKRIASNVYADRGHITQFFHQVGNKLAGAGYVLSARRGGAKQLGGGDVGHLVSRYIDKSLDISLRHIALQSYLSIFSGTTYAFLRGYYNYIAHGDARVYPAEVLGIRIPDINSYINARGLSLEFVSGYRWSKNLYFDFAYEFIWKGEKAHQATPSVHYNLATLWPKANSLWAHWDMVLAKGIGTNLSIEWMPYQQEDPTFWQRFSYFADAYLYNGLSLYGERNITAINPNSVLGFSAFLGARLNH